MQPTLQQFNQMAQQLKALQEQVNAMQFVFRNHKHRGTDGSQPFGFRDLADAPKLYIANDYVRVTADGNALHLSAT
jgi:hypothetical protein